MKTNVLSKLAVFLLLSAGFITIVIYYSDALPKSGRYKSDIFSTRCSREYTHDDSTEKTFYVNPNGTLYMDVDAASIKIETWDKNEVNVVVDKRGDEEKIRNFRVSFSNTPDRIEIHGERDHDFWNWGNSNITFYIKIPKTFKNDLHLSAGDIRINNLNGDTKIRASAGNINLKDIQGNIDIESSAGNIEMKDVMGNVKASTSAGNIKLYLINENQGVDLETSAGNIHVYVSDNIKATLQCSAGLGNASLHLKEGFSGSIDHNDIDGTINGGGKVIRMHTSIGNVSLSSLK